MGTESVDAHRYDYIRESMNMFALLEAFLADERGMESVEYGIVGTLIGVAVIVAFTGLGEAVAAEITRLTDAVLNGIKVRCCD